MTSALRLPLAAASAIAIAVLSQGCSSSEESSAPAPAATGTARKGCGDSRTVEYSPNMTTPSSGGAFVVRLVDGSPNPPARGMNDWKIRIEDRAGTPMPADGLEVKTFMPLHGHTSGVVPVVTPGSDGAATVGKIYFMMPGLWEVTFSLKNASPEDTSVISLCIEG